jgi:hypothetical protein
MHIAPRSPFNKRRALIAAALLLAAGAPPAGSQRLSSRRAVEPARIELNGRPLADVVVGTDDDGEVMLPVEALIRAVDGTRPIEASRLRQDGRRLYAAGVGGCTGCLLRVARPVVISARLRVVDGVGVFPLADLVAALEGRVRRHPATGVHEIFAGKCTWCILEPR